MSIAFDLFCFIFSFKIPNAVELSVWRGVGGCIWPNSVRFTLSGATPWDLYKHAPTSDSSAEGTTFLMTEAILRMETINLFSLGGLLPQKKQTS
jgi:hypothetical protein